MPIHNSEIAAIFNRIADLLDIKAENRFRIRAYRNAARTVEELSGSLAEMVENDEIQYVLGIPTQKPEIAQWMRRTCSVVNPNTGETISGFIPSVGNNQRNLQNGRIDLYDCGIS